LAIPALKHAAFLLLSFCSTVFAAEPQTVKFKAADGTDLVGVYIAPTKDKPVVVLLHGLASWKGEWAPLTAALTKQGWGSLSYDLRGHGDSSTHKGVDGPDGYKFFGAPGPGSQWQKMVDDIGAAFKYLETDQKIARKNLLLGGASLGANAALIYTALTGHPAKVFLLSPGLDYQKLETLPIVQKTKAKVLIVTSPADGYAFMSSQKLSQANSAVTLWSDVKPGHGVQMFDEALLNRLCSWLAQP
jgi:alpha-beta hydrolase superfamily lysophospholipase